LRVTFLLPAGGTRPSGGFKVVYEYANGLAARGHEVTVIHPAWLPSERNRYVATLRNRVFGYAVKGALRRWLPDRWFAIDPRVEMLWRPALEPRFIPDADAVIATWWRTAEIAAALPDRKGRKYYLVQHFEQWGGPHERVLATWRLPLTKIVIARWLEQAVRELRERSHYIPNGLDFRAFGLDTLAAQRPPASIAMLYHEYDWKGSHDGLAALHSAKPSVPSLRAELFGTAPRPRGLPEWISYHENPAQPELRALYNRAAIFLSPSWAEGWPLPPAEALACGCALICTDIGGHREYAIDGVTALLSAPRQPGELGRNIVRLARDAELRSALSARGHDFIKQFTWERAIDKLAAVLTCGESSRVDPEDRADCLQDDNYGRAPSESEVSHVLSRP
jgi:glycosyltransferase involved in cell wall biosynthesis